MEIMDMRCETNFIGRPSNTNVGETLSDMSDENVAAFLKYFETTLERSEQLTLLHPADLNVMSNIIYDRLKDISVLSSFCYGLFNKNKFLQKQLESLQLQVSGTDNILNIDRYDRRSALCTNLSTKKGADLRTSSSPLPDFNYLIESNKTLYRKNDELLTELLYLALSRESCDQYEQALIEKMVFELTQKRKETACLTSQITECINELLFQQNEVSQLLIENASLKTKLEQKSGRKRKLKRELHSQTKKLKLLESQIDFLESQKAELEALIDAGKTNFEKMNQIHLPLSPAHPSEHNNTAVTTSSSLQLSETSFPPLSKTVFSKQNNSAEKSNVSRNRKQRPQIFKNAQNSVLMQKWRKLNDNSSSSGFNLLLTPDPQKQSLLCHTSGVHQPDITSVESDCSSSQEKELTSISAFYRTHPNFGGVPESSKSVNDPVDRDTLYPLQQVDHTKTNYVDSNNALRNVQKTISRYTFLPPSHNSAINTDENFSTPASKNSWMLDTFTNFFKR